MDDCSSAKVDMLNTILISVEQLFLSVIRLCGSKNGYCIDMCIKEIGLHAQSMTIILGPSFNIIKGPK